MVCVVIILNFTVIDLITQFTLIEKQQRHTRVVVVDDGDIGVLRNLLQLEGLRVTNMPGDTGDCQFAVCVMYICLYSCACCVYMNVVIYVW